MNASRQEMVEDFSKHLQEKVQELVNRELRIASHVYSQPEIAVITMELAFGLVMGWACQCLMSAREGIDQDRFADELLAGIARGIVSGKDEVLAKANDPALRAEMGL